MRWSRTLRCIADAESTDIANAPQAMEAANAVVKMLRVNMAYLLTDRANARCQHGSHLCSGVLCDRALVSHAKSARGSQLSMPKGGMRGRAKALLGQERSPIFIGVSDYVRNRTAARNNAQ